MSTKNDLSYRVEIENLKTLFKIVCRPKQFRPKQCRPKKHAPVLVRFFFYCLIFSFQSKCRESSSANSDDLVNCGKYLIGTLRRIQSDNLTPTIRLIWPDNPITTIPSGSPRKKIFWLFLKLPFKGFLVILKKGCL